MFDFITQILRDIEKKFFWPNLFSTEDGLVLTEKENHLKFFFRLFFSKSKLLKFCRLITLLLG